MSLTYEQWKYIIKEGDKRHSYPKCSCCGEPITGKVFPGQRDIKCHNEAVNPDG